MYKEEQKQSFINRCAELGATDAYIQRVSLLFRRIAKFEERCSADVSEINPEQASELYASGLMKATTAHISLCILKSYTAWCIRNGWADADSGIMKFMPDDIADARMTMVSGDRQLADYLDGILPPVEEGTANNLIRAFLWMCFAGIQPHDIESVQNSDVNIAEKTVRARGYTHLLSPLAMPAVEFSVKADVLSIDHPQYKSRDRIKSGCIMRGTSSVLSMTDITKRLTLIQKNQKRHGRLWMKLTPMSVFWSGMFYEMYLLERSGTFPDFSEYAERFMEFRIDHFGTRYEMYEGIKYEDTYRNMLMIKMLENYSEWKLAFVQ